MTPSTPAVEAQQPDHGERKDGDDYLYLTGRPSLKDFLGSVRARAVNPPDAGTLIDEWRAAAEEVRRLEASEAGCADDPVIGEMGLDYEPLLVEFLKDPLVRYGFEKVPTDVAFVELDRLIMFQQHIDLTHVQYLDEQLAPTLSPEDIFRLCLRHDRPTPAVKWSSTHRDQYVFVSPSNDLRFLGAMQLQAHHIVDYPPPGDLAGVLGIAIGFGRNFLSAIYTEQRLLLLNGTHRAFTLRRRGITHAPCIIQHVSSRDELALLAPQEVNEHPDRFLKQPRPMMLKDFFNPRLRREMKVHRRLRQITVKFEVVDADIPAF
jgi:hypothetical protein